MKSCSYIFFAFILLANINLFGQSNSKSLLTYHLGIGIADGAQMHGGGMIFGAGYQYSIPKYRLHFQQNISIGVFNSDMIQDVPDLFINSISLESVVFFDIIKYKEFALSLGTGPVLCNYKGLEGSGGYPPKSGSDYINKWYYGVYLGSSISITPIKSRLVYSIMPMNFYVGPDSFLQGFAKIGVGVKL